MKKPPNHATFTVLMALGILLIFALMIALSWSPT